MDEEIFFEKYNIGSYEELEELPFKFRDASDHFYHKNTNSVYSRYIYGDREWYISGFANEIKFRHTEPEAYAKQVEEGNKNYAIEREKEREFEAQFLSVDEIIAKHKDKSGDVVLTKQFIDDIVANHQYSKIFGRGIHGCFLIPAMDYIRSQSRFEELKKLGMQDATTVYTHPPTSFINLDFCYDFEYEGEGELYLELNELPTRVGTGLILTTGTGIRACTEITFVVKDGGELVPMKGVVKFKGISANAIKEQIMWGRVVCHSEYGTILTDNAVVAAFSFSHPVTTFKK